MKQSPIRIVCLLLTTCAFLGAVEPREALADFKQIAKKGDFKGVWKMMLKLPNLPPETEGIYRDKVEKGMTRFREGADFEIVDQKVDGDSAVIVINEIKGLDKKAANYDPIYLLKQEGEWKFFPSLSSYRQAAQIAPETVEKFERLRAWYDQQEEILKRRPVSE